MKKILLATTFAAILANWAPARLVFDQEAISMLAVNPAKEAGVVFRFSNVSEKPVTITNVESRDCAVAKLAKDTYQPNERGEIPVTLSLAGRGGLQQTEIIVTTNDAECPTYKLKFDVKIPAIIFEAETVHVDAVVAAKEASGVFKFTNTSPDKTVAITQVKPSCGCTTAKLSKDKFAPKETGEITATLNLTGRIGTQTKSIAVTTDDPDKPTFNLTLEVKIPEVLKINPPSLIWQKNEERTPKTILVENVLEQPVKVVKLNSSNPQVGMDLKEIEAGRKYEITFTPKPDEQSRNVNVSIITDLPGDPPPVYNAYLRFQ